MGVRQKEMWTCLLDVLDMRLYCVLDVEWNS